MTSGAEPVRIEDTAVTLRALRIDEPANEPVMPRSPINTGFALVAALVLAAAALWPGLWSLVAQWLDVHDYQHGPLVAAVSVAWLAIAIRRWQWLPLEPSIGGCLLLAGGLAGWLVTFNANSLIAFQLLAPVVIWLAVLAMAGWAAARHLIAPLAYLYFAIPLWEYLLPVLQRMSVFATETALGLAGIPAIVREYMVTIPEGTFQIVEGCSGKRYFMVTLALAVLAAFLNHLRGWRLVVFLLASAALALVVNWLRIFVVIYAGHVTDMQHYLVAKEHITFGNVVFAVLLGMVLLLGRWMTPRSLPVAAAAAAAPAAAIPPRAIRLWLRLLPLGLLAGTFVLVQARTHFEGESPALRELPLSTEHWQGPLPAMTSWQPLFVGAVAERRASYSSPSGSIEIYVNLYGDQEQGRELVYFQNTLLAPEGWQQAWPHRLRRLADASGHALASFEAGKGDGSRWLVAYTYDVGGWTTGSQVVAQLAYGARSVLRPVPAGVVALAARCEPNCESAQALVEAFWGEMSNRVLAMMPHQAIRARQLAAGNLRTAAGSQ